MSGVGKALCWRSCRVAVTPVVDTDYDGWTLLDGTWDEPRMAALLAERGDVVVSGTVETRVASTAALTRSFCSAHHSTSSSTASCEDRNNPYGKTAEQRAEIERYVGEVEPLLRRGATVELDGRCPVGGLADIVEQVLAAAS